jgi:hypothetical protein
MHALALPGSENDDVENHWEEPEYFTEAAAQFGTAPRCQLGGLALTLCKDFAERLFASGRDIPVQHVPHQEQIDFTGALAAFADRPDDQRLAAAHVAGSEDLGTLVA